MKKQNKNENSQSYNTTIILQHTHAESKYMWAYLQPGISVNAPIIMLTHHTYTHSTRYKEIILGAFLIWHLFHNKRIYVHVHEHNNIATNRMHCESVIELQSTKNLDLMVGIMHIAFYKHY